MRNDDPGDAAPTPPGQDAPDPAFRDAATFEHAVTGVAGEGSGLYQLLVESVRDYAIFALDANGYVLSWNAGAERLKGYRAHEIIGQHFSVFYPEPAKTSQFPQYELRMAAAEGRFEDEGWRLRKDGSRFWANVVITALRDETGVLVGFAKVTRDLTERRASEQRALEDARRLAEVQAANRARSGFLAALSHELRTPLNAIGGYAELMEMGVGGTPSEQQIQYLERIRNSQQHLLGIINDLLNYSRIEAGQVQYETEAVSVHALAGAVMSMVEPQALRKGLVLHREPCPDEVAAMADRLKVEQIVLNLLSNAVKFTPEGGRVTIACALVGGQVSVSVADTGPGIPAAMQEAVFDPFVQLGRSLTNVTEGAGLGLAISRDMARAMGGDVTVHSTPGQGATFTLLLPRA